MLRFAFVVLGLCCAFALVSEKEASAILAVFTAAPEAPIVVTVPTPPSIAKAKAAADQQAAQDAAPPKLQVVSAYGSGGGGRMEVAIPMSRANAFPANFTINGMPVPAIVDTGAAAVSITMETANRLGIYVSGRAPDGMGRSANGPMPMWAVRLSSIGIDGILLPDVIATVRNDPGGMNLIGMTFLSRLSSFENRGQVLVLRQ
jgi:aspartyl protease family protein